jgi:two-component system chemotaxis response regulator CheY
MVCCSRHLDEKDLDRAEDTVRRALIVDDDPVTRTILVSCVSSLVACDEASGGQQAFDMVERSYADSKPYDLVCLDIEMPGMDGRETLSRIRRMEHERGLPDGTGVRVLMVSAKADSGNVFGSFDTASDGYLVKPIRKTALMDALRDLDMVPGEDLSWQWKAQHYPNGSPRA